MMMGGDRTALYRHFGKDGELLYIGISLSAVQRLKQHKADKAWAGEITSMHVEYFETRSSALDAERAAIIKENPIWNKLHNQHRNPVSPVRYDDGPTGKPATAIRLFESGVAAGVLIEWNAGNQKRRGAVERFTDFLGIPMAKVRVLRRNGTFGAIFTVRPEDNPVVIREA